MFIAQYERRSTFDPLILKGIAPLTPSSPDVPLIVQALSPMFVKIYSQALTGEAHGLDHLTGIGLRKALEFLIKDFAIAEYPAKKPDIVVRNISSCLSEFIDDVNIKECARRAVWLGNDEAHYERKWADKDVDDLKRLIRLSMNWIENVLETRKYLAEMKPPGTGTQASN
jgi:hypothetical protein